MCRFTVPVVQWKIPLRRALRKQHTGHETIPPQKVRWLWWNTRFCHHCGSRIHESPRTASKLRCCSWIKRCWASNSSCNSGSFPAKCRISLKLPGAYNHRAKRIPESPSNIKLMRNCSSCGFKIPKTTAPKKEDLMDSPAVDIKNWWIFDQQSSLLPAFSGI